MANLEQQIAQTEAKLARLKEKNRKLENGQKIIIGGMMIALAKKDYKVARALIDYCQTEIKRDVDIKRLKPLIDELKLSIKENEQGY